jgi:trans-aconitate methyltransferase
LALAGTGARVVGIDPAPDFIRAALEKGLDARLMRAEDMTFEAEFDAAMSNAVLHWIKNPQPTAARVFAALKPGGRFVAEFGGFGNIAAIRAALHEAIGGAGFDPMAIDPWYYPTPDEYSAVLTGVGFRVEEAFLMPRPTPLPTNMRGWLTTFAAGWLAAALGEATDAVLDQVSARLQPILCDESGNWMADYVRLRVVAVRPG